MQFSEVVVIVKKVFLCKRRRYARVISMCVVVARMTEGSGLEMNSHQGVGANVTSLHQH